MKKKIIRIGEGSHVCGECNKAFSQLSTLKNHKRSVHTPIRSHACDKCDKRFTSADSLKTHGLLHEGI